MSPATVGDGIPRWDMSPATVGDGIPRWDMTRAPAGDVIPLRDFVIIACLARQGEHKTRAGAGSAFHPQAAVEIFDDLTADRQAEPSTLRLVGEHVGSARTLAELVEYDFLILGMNAGTVVRDADAHFARRAAGADYHPAAIRRHEFQGIRQQVHHHLHQAVAVRHDAEAGLALLEVQGHVLVGEQHGQRIRGFADHLADIDGGHGPFGTAGFKLGQVQNLVDQSRQTHGLADDDGEKARALRQIDLRIFVQHFRERPDRSQRRAQLVGHGGNEIVLHPIQLAQALIGLAQFRRGNSQFQRLLFQFARVGAHLGSFVENIHHLVDAQRFLGHHRGDHRPCRSRSDRPRQQGLGEVHQARIRGKFLDVAQAAFRGMTGK